MTSNTWTAEAIEDIAGLMKDMDICMFVTRSNGSMRKRPMSNNGKVEWDGDSWFFSFRDSAKVEEIEADLSVELAYIATERGTWMSLEGTAEVVEDDAKKREVWEDSLAGWFKEGPDDDKVVLLKVRASRIHAWTDGQELIAEPGKAVKRIEG
ncbi:MAG TPA: pyridoxamine 5'-phosphate oxidase family protein [Candidatus Limnocylindrales bacterium]|nr:pyridoxamine 5'-phosphate oxidase family protein [Candidatus Limnocylindrales bacterium]